MTGKAHTKALDEARLSAESWIDAFVEILTWRDRERSFLAMVAALHALRDSLPNDEAANLGNCLPTVLRGYYYEGWHLHGPDTMLSSRDAFLRRIEDALHRDPAIDAEAVGRALFRLLAERLSKPELENARATTPAELHALWPS